ncbi:DUF805 domain-containing protein [Kangiella sp. TOML190]|uniref:DUF805 domain-containing protein n=1 Tax=Kangiella sp. TOML190 TaxID=2931351 RepID=UPI00203ACA2C|nr:DUF805 domain-containing protein [Kangiella sp. TOML190]
MFEIPAEDIIVKPQEEKPLSPLEAIKNGCMKFSDFSGTASRYEYWWFFAFALVIAALATLVHNKAYQLVAIVALVPFVAVGTRRLNDIQQSPWWQLMWLVPFGQLVVLYLSALKPKE